MAYFTQEFVDFFKELAKNNNKEWFHANKKRYEQNVKKPFYSFVQSIIDELKKEDPGLKIEVKNTVFRINRDIRFSKDKSPYKNHVAAAISRGGRKDMQYPGIYIHLEPGNFMMAGGCYMPDKENLYLLRKYIIDHPEEIKKALSDPTFVKMYGGLAEGEKNKILPKEFKEHGASHPLIFNKQYYYYKTISDENIFLAEDLLKLVIDHYKGGEPWNQIIRNALYS